MSETDFKFGGEEPKPNGERKVMKIKAWAVAVESNGSIFEYSDGGYGSLNIERCLSVNASEEGARAAAKFIEEEGSEKMKVVPCEIEI